MIKVTYMEHCGFVVTTPTAILVFDLAKDPSHALKKAIKNNAGLPVYFFVSHHQADHFNPAIFDMAQECNRIYILSYDIESKHVPDKGMQVQFMSPGDSVSDLPGDIAVKAYRSTGAGVAYVVTTPDGKTIFHAGDLNDNMKADGREESEFVKTVGRIAEDYPELTVAMMSVDTHEGANVEQGARRMMEMIKVDNFFPMHIYGGDKQACDFAQYVPERTAAHCLKSPGEHFDVV